VYRGDEEVVVSARWEEGGRETLRNRRMRRNREVKFLLGDNTVGRDLKPVQARPCGLVCPMR